MQIFPGRLALLWNNWEVRGMVLVSLTLQIILITLGNRRKHNTRNWIRIVLWLAYLSADWVATVSLGVLSNGQGDSKDDSPDSLDPNYVIMAFWAPFLLVHLGGPDTITAYSLEDNELWLRHLLGLVVQVGVAIYVFIRSLQPTPLNFVAFPIFVAGIIKYGERTWILRSASSKHFRESLLPRPDPGPNYSKFIEEYVLKETEGFELSCSVTQAPKVVAHNYAAGKNSIIPNAGTLNAAYDFFLTFKRLFADLILSFQDLERSLSFFQESSWENAFKVIEVELGFMYDVLYTKASIIHSIWGAALRTASLSSTIIALIVFCAIDWKGYHKIDLSISLILLVGAIGLEIYAVLLLLSSDWTPLLLSRLKTPSVNVIYKFISCLSWVTSKKKWSNSMAQYNLLTSCLNDKATIWKFLRDNIFLKIVDDYQYESSEDIPTDINKSIFKQLVDKSKGASDFRVCKQLCGAKGEQVLQKYNCLDKFSWSVEVEFDHSILLWHIATDLCFLSDQKEDPNSVIDPNCKVSKLLSDYMLYLLVKRPFMLPNGIGQIRFQDTCAETTEFFQELKVVSDEHACRKLLQVDIIIPPQEVKGDRSKSVLFDACKLANSLQSLEIEEQWGKQQKWEMISRLWIEILSFAACQCTWKDHAQQLRRGGELITHVWLLMAHLGLTEQFQISHGHARTRLIVQ